MEAEAVTVTGEATESLTSGSAEESAKQEKTVPGASIDVTADASTEPNPEIFHPGDGRSF